MESPFGETASGISPSVRAPLRVGAARGMRVDSGSPRRARVLVFPKPPLGVAVSGSEALRMDL